VADVGAEPLTARETFEETRGSAKLPVEQKWR
jgi:hypothetical protein